MSEDPKPLSPRHARFVAEYLKTLNATRAYISAGYAPRTAAVNASKLLRHVGVKAAIAEGHRQIAETEQITVEEIAAHYARMARANVDDFITVEADGRIRIDLARADRARRAGLVEISVTDYGEGRPQKVTIKLGRLQALAALTRGIGLLVARPAPGPAAKEDTLDTLAEDIAAARMRARGSPDGPPMEAQAERARESQAAAQAKVADPAIEPPPAVPAATPTDQPGRTASPPAASEPPRDLRRTLRHELGPCQPHPAPQGIPPRDSPEFHDLLGKLRRGTLDFAMTHRMIAAGYGPEPEPDMTYQMEVNYEPNWG